jgi:hypothetical protein
VKAWQKRRRFPFGFVAAQGSSLSHHQIWRPRAGTRKSVSVESAGDPGAGKVVPSGEAKIFK